MISTAEQAAMLHRETLILDSHLDVLVSTSHPLLLQPEGRCHTDLDHLLRGQINAAVMSVAPQVYPRTAAGQAQARAEAEEKMRAIHGIIDVSGNRMELAMTAQDVRRVVAEGRIAVLIGYQNVQGLSSVDELGPLYAAGVRVLDLVHADNNQFADSSRAKAPEHDGLSALGKMAVSRLNALGILIDVSQLSMSATLQAIELSSAPVAATHSAVRGLVDTPRNLSDEALDVTAAKGGVVQIVPFGNYLIPPPSDYAAQVEGVRSRLGLANGGPTDIVYRGSETLSEEDRGAFLEALMALWPPASVKTLVDHIDYVVQRVGIDHVGIGTDFNHGSGIAGFANLGEAETVTSELLSRGYGQSDIAKIWGGNFLRVLEAAQNVTDH